mmetsp:Transcript_75042/g.229616  ORF Transcript_75042/g.229616 Transcript_75042/m.229616 type:complete len:295 (+) Transcript_75042:195-1079(+)
MPEKQHSTKNTPPSRLKRRPLDLRHIGLGFPYHAAFPINPRIGLRRDFLCIQERRGKDGFTLPLTTVHDADDGEGGKQEHGEDNDQGDAPLGKVRGWWGRGGSRWGRGGSRWRRGGRGPVGGRVLDALEGNRAAEARRPTRQHLGVQEIDAGLEIHRCASGGHMNRRRDHVQRGGAIAGAERRGAERDLDVVGVLNESRAAEFAAVVQEVDLAEGGVPRGVDDDQHVRVGSQDIAHVDASPASRLVREHIDEARRLHDQIGRPRPSPDEELRGIGSASLVLATTSDAIQPHCLD